MAKKTPTQRYNLVNDLHAKILELTTTTKAGEVKMKRKDLKDALEALMLNGVKRAAGGERIRFPVIGALVSKPVKARKAGKGKNPFTGEDMVIKARPESRKPRWSFPKAVKESFANKKHW